jgi:Tol biopolymer transport system component
MMKKIILICILAGFFIPGYSYYFGKNKVQSKKIEWAKAETLHFDIYYDKADSTFGQIAILMAEEAYYFLKEDLRLPVKQKIPLIFYPSHQDFATTNIIFPLLNEAVGGFTESTKNRVAVPYDGSLLKLEQVLIHELTHAYLNELNQSNIKLVHFTNLPFWFSEGFPEFFSVKGESVYNNMFVIDLLLHDKIYDLNMIGGFYAYRLGESFLNYLADEYGRKTVLELFYALRISSNMDVVSQKIFGLKFNELQERWQNSLKRKYFSLFSEYSVPPEVYHRKTDHRKDGSFMNYAPRFSPDGNSYLYFSDRNLRNSIWSGSTFDLVNDKQMVQGESSGKYEEFHFRRNNIAWLPDSLHFAFVSKTSYGDRIYIMNSKTNKILEEIAIPNLDVIYEIDIDKGGDRIALSGQKDHQTDIYIYYRSTQYLEQLTNDKYYNYQPNWSPDGTKIVFSAERAVDKPNEHIFYNLNSNIFYYDVLEKAFYQVTFDIFNNYFPIWTNDSKKILMATEREVISNFELINIESGERAKVTNSLGGVFSGDLDADNKSLIFSCFYQVGWDIFILDNPLDSLHFEPYQVPQEVVFIDDLYERFEIERYKVFGFRERKFKKTLPEVSRENVTRIEFGDIVKRDSLYKQYNMDIDSKPVTEQIPLIKPYKVKFSLDSFWGGMAYSASGGAFGQLQLSMSDLMGNHYLGFSFGVYRELKNSDFIFNYLYLERRIDYGFGGFYLNDEVIYRIFHAGDFKIDYMREREREYGIYGILRYPFNKFWRLDWENVLQKYEIRRDWWKGTFWEEEFLPEDFQSQFPNYPVFEDEWIYRPQFSIVFDNAVYGSVGPLAGWRSTVFVNTNLSNHKPTYGLLYGDIRKYNFFAKRYSFASRIFGGIIFGNTNRYFELDSFYDVRGYEKGEEELSEKQQGTKKLVASFEFRFPFIDNLKMSFPLPLYFYNIRGSLFFDIGSVWENNKDFQFYDGRELQDVKIGFGFGPRLNMGFFIVKLDIAWSSNLIQASKPVYYLSLSEDF